MAERLVCPKCQTTWAKIRREKAGKDGQDGVFVNRIESVRAHEAPSNTAPCGLPLVRLHEKPATAVDETCKYRQASVVAVEFASAELFDAKTGEKLPATALPAPNALGRSLNKERKESR